MKKYAFMLILTVLLSVLCASCETPEIETPRITEAVEETSAAVSELPQTAEAAPEVTTTEEPSAPIPYEPGENTWTEYTFSDMHPIVFNGILLGGSYNGGMWISAESLAEYVLGTELYTLYNETEAYSNGFGGAVLPAVASVPYSHTQFVDVREFAPVDMNDVNNVGLELPPGILALSANWDAMPRLAATQALKNDTYEQIVKDILAENGLVTDTVNITQHYRLDFEGDGVDEVVLYAESPYTDYRYETTDGAYSLLIVRKIVNGKVQNFVLHLDFHTDVEGFYEENGWHDVRYLSDIYGFYDLNGDGILELLVKWSYYEGSLFRVYEINADGPELVLKNGSGV